MLPTPPAYRRGETWPRRSLGALWTLFARFSTQTPLCWAERIWCTRSLASTGGLQWVIFPPPPQSPVCVGPCAVLCVCVCVCACACMRSRLVSLWQYHLFFHYYFHIALCHFNVNWDACSIIAVQRNLTCNSILVVWNVLRIHRDSYTLIGLYVTGL